MQLACAPGCLQQEYKKVHKYLVAGKRQLRAMEMACNSLGATARGNGDVLRAGCASARQLLYQGAVTGNMQPEVHVHTVCKHHTSAYTQSKSMPAHLGAVLQGSHQGLE
jgi:hypothetical protein